MAKANCIQASQHVPASDLTKINPLIDSTRPGTINRVQAVLRYLALVTGEPNGCVPTDEDAYGLSLIIQTCADALDYPMEYHHGDH